ncbi:MAG: hypothetical protein M1830_004222, partial [Pleopsidium flavum]
AYAVPREIEGNGIVSFIEYVLLPVSALKHGDNARFVIDRREGEGEPLVYSNIETLKEDYKADRLTPQLLKSGVANALVSLLEPIQADFQASSAWQDIERKAYLTYPPPETKKKEKKVKDKGSKHPGAAKGVEAQPDGSVEGRRKDQVSLGTGIEETMKKLDALPNGAT